MAHPTTSPTDASVKIPATTQIWWSNGIFFVGMHIIGLFGVLYLSPWRTLDTKTMWLCFFSWQLASFGITIGYHRLWSHKGFTARWPLRVALAIMGSLGFQGSIKWWVLRHRLHHRFTDDPVHDPYAASRGLFFSHMGWIFLKPKYERLTLIEKADLERDPVVRFQHKHYIPIALFFGLVVPTLIGALWGDALGGYIWGGVIARLLIWHCTFMINSLAHWEGLQPYSDDMSARGDFLLALFTSGEGNHNFHHAFPQDFRNGPHPLDWDPTKWIIWTLHKLTPFVPSLRVTPSTDVLKARAYMLELQARELEEKNPTKKAELEREAAALRAAVPEVEWGVEEGKEEVWGRKELERYVENGGRKVLLVDGWAVDVTGYLKTHPGGSYLLNKHLAIPSIASTHDSGVDISDAEDIMRPLRDASAAFNGGMNNHSRAAREKLKVLRVARIIEP